MKKLVFILIAALLLSLAGCGGNNDVDLPEITGSTADATEPSENGSVQEQPGQTEGDSQEQPLVFNFSGVDLIPGTPFDPAALPAYESIYTIPSCAGEGTDNVYSYGALELTAFDDGNGEVIYSVYLMDPNLTTPEGLALGDPMSRAEELYGTGYASDGTSRTYTSGGVMLVLLLDGNDNIFSIEYRMSDN